MDSRVGAIEVEGLSGHREKVPAFLIGDWLAVHGSLNRGGWTVTHIPTRLAVRREIPLRDAALKFAEALSGLDWSVTREQAFGDKALRRAVEDAVKRYLRVPDFEAHSPSTRGGQ